MNQIKSPSRGNDQGLENFNHDIKLMSDRNRLLCLLRQDLLTDERISQLKPIVEESKRVSTDLIVQ